MISNPIFLHSIYAQETTEIICNNNKIKLTHLGFKTSKLVFPGGVNYDLFYIISFLEVGSCDFFTYSWHIVVISVQSLIEI